MSPTRADDYEKVSIYRLDPAAQDELLHAARECVFNWCTKDQWPMGVIMSCLWQDGRMWLTAGAHRHRIAAVRRNPRVSVVISSSSTDLTPNRTVTIKGRCSLHEDRETLDWFYPAFAHHLNPGDERAARAFVKRLDSPLRVVLEIEPVKFITYDGTKMFAHAAGQIDESQLAEPLESDTVRLARELERRGMQ